MSVIRRGKSKNWYVQFQVGGQTVIKSARTTSRKVAEQMEAQLRAQVHAGVYLGHKPTLSFGEALARFASAKEGTPNHRNVISYTRSILRLIPASTPLELVGTRQIEEYCRARKAAGIGSQALKHGINMIRGAIQLAHRQGFRTPEIIYPTVKVSAGRLRYLSPDEETALLDALDPAREGNGLAPVSDRRPEMQAAIQDLYDLVVVLLDTGARCGEINRLEWRQIDLETRQIRLWRPKVRNESIIFMTRRVHAILTRRLAATASPYVFTNKAGGPRDHHRSAWRKAFNRAGLHDCTIHTLRHTHATRLIQNGLSVYEVQTVLGHSDPKTTMRYAHLEQAKVTAKARDVIETLSNAASRKLQ